MTDIERQALQIVRQMLIGGLAQSEHDDVRALTAEKIAEIEQHLFDPEQFDGNVCG